MMAREREGRTPLEPSGETPPAAPPLLLPAPAVPPFSDNLFLESFRDVPRADLEIAFPDKRPYVSSSDYVSLAVNLVLVLVSAVTLLLTTELK
jgi:hypothetical protein